MPASTQNFRPEGGYAVEIAAVQEECQPREWTTEVSRRVMEIMGPRCVRAQRWTVRELGAPGVFWDATEAASDADILVLSVCADGELPADIHRWIDSWLPRRVPRCGVLVAVLGVPQGPNVFPARIRQYLQDVAGLAHLDFLPRERRLPPVHAAFLAETIANGTPESRAVGVGRCFSSWDWGVDGGLAA